MRLNKYKYFFFVVIIFLNANLIIAQQSEEYAIVKIDSIIYPTNNKIQFDLRIEKISDKWNYLANGTFQIGFDDPNFQITPNNISLNIVADTTCDFLKPIIINPLQSSQNLKDSAYILTWAVLNNRISITLGGPLDVNNCEYFSLNQQKRLGRFEIETSEPSIPAKLIFLKGDNPLHPYYFYQAIAYKTEKQIFWNNSNNVRYNLNDNIEMDNGIDSKVIYVIDDRQPEMDEDSLQAFYAGNFKVELRWMTRSEPYHKGFIIERLWKPFDHEGIEGLTFDTPVGSWNSGKQQDSILKFNPANIYGKNPYIYQFDVVPQREERYYYRLLYQTMQDSIISLDTTFIDIPAVLIYDINASNNPFGDYTDNKTDIIFHLEEDAYVTCKVFDLEGRLVETLINNELRKMGENRVTFSAKPFSQQGLYNVVVEAIPVVAMKIDKGKAVYKLQFLR